MGLHTPRVWNQTAMHLERCKRGIYSSRYIPGKLITVESHYICLGGASKICARLVMQSFNLLMNVFHYHVVSLPLVQLVWQGSSTLVFQEDEDSISSKFISNNYLSSSTSCSAPIWIWSSIYFCKFFSARCMQPCDSFTNVHISIQPLIMCYFYQTNNKTFCPGCWCCRSATGFMQIQILLLYCQHLLWHGLGRLKDRKSVV